MTVVLARGVPVEVHVHGDGANIVFVHGEDGLLFSAPVLRGLAGVGAVHAIVLPGWGEQPRPDHVTTIDDLAIVLLDYLATLDAPAVLVGVSLGAWVVAEALVRDTRRVRAAVLASPVGIKVRGRTDRDYLDLYAASEADVNAALWAGAPTIDRAHMADVEFAALALAQDATTRFVWKPYFHDPKLRGRLSRVDVPVSIVYGARDGFVYDAREFYGAYADAFVPPARCIEVARAAHRVDEQQPDAIVDAVLAIIENPEGRAS